MESDLSKRLLKRACKICLIFLFCLFVIACDFGNLFDPTYDESFKDYLEYWSSACQVGRVDYLSEHVKIGDDENLSITSDIELELIIINPKNLALLRKTGGGACFRFTNEAGNLVFSNYSEQLISPQKIKIRARLTDASEGQRITVTGCLWPENATGFNEATLRRQDPDLFYSTSFIQNTPPDSVSNLYVPSDTISGKHYVSFEMPDQTKNKNRNSSYEIHYFLRENGSLNYKGSRIVPMSENKATGSASNIFKYFFDDQENNLSYEYTVTTIGPHGRKSEQVSTDPGLGVHVMVEPTISFDSPYNGQTDAQGFRYIEIPSSATTVGYSITSNEDGAVLSGTIDSVAFTGEQTGTLPTGQHTIVATVHKDNCRDVTVTKKVNVIQALGGASFSFGVPYNGHTDANGFAYYEVDTATSTLSYTIDISEAGTTVSGNVDGVDYSGAQSGTLSIGAHTLVATIHKTGFTDTMVTRKVMVVKKLDEATYVFDLPFNGNTDDDGYQYIEVDTLSSTVPYTISSESDTTMSVAISGSSPSSDTTVTNTKTGTLGIGTYEINVTVRKPNHVNKVTATKKVKVVKKLAEPTVTFDLPFNSSQAHADGYWYIEVDSASATVPYTISSESGTTITGTAGTSFSTAGTSTENEKTGSLGVGTYTITATAQKSCYNNSPTKTLNVKVIQTLSVASFEFGRPVNVSTNASGAQYVVTDNDGYQYIEVDTASSTVTYEITTAEAGATVSANITGTTALTATSGTLGVGYYTIEATVHKENYTDRIETKKIKVVKKLDEAEITLPSNMTYGHTDGEGFTYYEVNSLLSTVPYTIAIPSTEASVAGTSITGTIDGTPFTGAQSNVSLAEGEHTLVATIHREYYNDKTVTRKIKVVQALSEPTFSFGGAHSANHVESSGNVDYEYYEVDTASSTMTYEVIATDFGATVSVTISGTSSSMSSSGNLGVGDYTIVATVSKNCYNPKVVTKHIKVVTKLSEPTFTFTSCTYNLNGHVDSSGNEYYEVDTASSTMGYEIITSESGASVAVSITNSAGTQISTTTSGNLGVGDYTIVATVSKNYYRDKVVTKHIKVVTKLAAPTISFNVQPTAGASFDYNGNTYKVIEYTDSLTATANNGNGTGSAISVTSGDGSPATGTSSATKTILSSGEGYYTITATVSKDYYNSVTATERVYAVRALTAPTITLSATSGNNTVTNPNDGNSYTIVEYSGTLTATATDTYIGIGTGSSVSISVNGNATQTIATTANDDGYYVITATVTKAHCTSKTSTMRVYAVKSLSAPEISFNPTFNNVTHTDGFQYIEVNGNETVTCTISSEAGTTLTGNANGSYTTTTNTHTATLTVGNTYTITATAQKANASDSSTTTKKVKVVQALSAPTITTTHNSSGAGGGYDYYEVASASGKVTFTINGSGTGLTGTVTNETTGAVTNIPGNSASTTLELGIGEYVITAAATKADQNNSEPETRNVKVVQVLAAPTIITTHDSSGTSGGYDYYEVASASGKVTFTITGSGTGLTGSVNKDGTVTNYTENTTSKTLELGTGTYTITASATKSCQSNSALATKMVKVVQALTAPSIGPTSQTSCGNDGTYYYYEVASGGTVSFTITGSGTGLTGTVTNETTGAVTNVPGNSASTTLNLGTGTYTITARSTKANQNNSDQATMKVKVVQALSAPTITTTHNSSGTVDGYDYYEVASASGTISFTIAGSGTGLTGAVNKDGTVTNYTESAGTKTLNIGTGTYTITATATKSFQNNSSQTTKKIKVVEQLSLSNALQTAFYSDAARSTVVSQIAPENTAYGTSNDYRPYNINLDSSGNGSLYYTFTPASGVTLTTKEGSTTLGNASSLAVGPHTLSLTVAKAGYTTQVLPLKVYVEGVLADATISPTGTNTGSNNYQFSYLTYEEMPVTVTVGNTGNTISSVTAAGTNKTVTGNTFYLPDGFSGGNIVITQTKANCRTKTTTLSMGTVSIKPITVSVPAEATNSNACWWLKYNSTDSGDTAELRGKLYLRASTNSSWKLCRELGDSSGAFACQAWDWAKLTDGYSVTFNSVMYNGNYNHVEYCAEDMYEDDDEASGYDSDNDDPLNTVQEIITLQQIRNAYSSGKATFEFESGSSYCRDGGSNNGTHSISHRIIFTVTE